MAEEWYVGRNGQQSGPFTPRQLRQMAASGQLSKADLVWKEGFADWVPCSSVKGLFPAVADFSPRPESPRPPPRPTAPPPKAPPAIEEKPAGAAVTGAGEPPHPGQATPHVSTIAAGALPLADFLPRVGAALLDSLFIGLIGCVPNVALAAILIAANANNPENADAAVALMNVCSSGIGILVGAVYYVPLDASAKQGTWGKQIVGLKVTDLEGGRISVSRAIGRFLARYLTICTCGIGYLLPLFTKNRQTLHDLICGCIVVNK